MQDSLVEEFEKSKQTLEEDLSKIDSKSADYLQGYEEAEDDDDYK